MKTITHFDLDADRHLTLYSGRSIVWEGSPEALAADGDIRVPGAMLAEIELATEDHDAAETARDDRGFRSRNAEGK